MTLSEHSIIVCWLVPWWPLSPSSPCIFSAADSNLGEPLSSKPLSQFPASMGGFRLLAPRQEEVLRVSHNPSVSEVLRVSLIHLCPCCSASGEPSS